MTPTGSIREIKMDEQRARTNDGDQCHRAIRGRNEGITK